jgi:molybdate transport system ATP-binding protein
MYRLNLDNVSLKLGGRTLLEDISLEVGEGERWIVYGPNGSGKSLLGRIVSGRLGPSSGRLVSEEWPGYPDSVGYVSFELMETLLEEERRADETWFHHGDVDPGRTPRDLFASGAAGDPELLERLVSRFEIAPLLDRGLKFLSTGELRKVLLVNVLRRGVSLLILDDPFDGLDASSRSYLEGMIDALAAEGTGYLLILGRYEEIPRSAEKILVLDNGRTSYKGTISDAPRLERNFRETPTVPPDRPIDDVPEPETEFAPGDEILRLEDVSVSYGSTAVLTDLNWTVRWGEQWMIHGPNGAGKSTLLSMVNADSPKVYNQAFYFRGVRRGSGESVWDIKKLIGFVSGDLQLSYSVYATHEEVVLSGLYDSIGLYREPSGYEKRCARKWLDRIGLIGRGEERFSRASFGEQRMVLIARAMIKGPRILIADEPCQGLDDRHRVHVLDLLEGIAASGETLLLYVTHDPAEDVPSVSRRLELVPHPSGGYTGRTIGGAIGETSSRS